MKGSVSVSTKEISTRTVPRQEEAAATAVALEGRISLWIHNDCEAALRIGQEGTDEVIPLGPGVKMAYR